MAQVLHAFEFEESALAMYRILCHQRDKLKAECAATWETRFVDFVSSKSTNPLALLQTFYLLDMLSEEQRAVATGTIISVIAFSK